MVEEESGCSGKSMVVRLNSVVNHREGRVINGAQDDPQLRLSRDYSSVVCLEIKKWHRRILLAWRDHPKFVCPIPMSLAHLSPIALLRSQTP